jgi:peroxiredoxin
MRKIPIWLSGLALVLGLGLGKGAHAMDKPVYDKPQDIKPLGKGDRIPDGELTTLEGKKTVLGELVSQKPTILIFYRGGWCPFCITPDKPESLRASLQKHRINYTLLSDSGLKVIRRFGLAYQLDPETLARMGQHGVDLDSATGNSLHQLPVPAAYVVDTKGLIHFVYYNPDIRVRVDPLELMKAARELLKR